VNEAVRQFVESWRRVSRAFPHREVGELEGLSVAWGGVPYVAWNALIQSSPGDLDGIAQRATEFMRARKHAGMLFLCEEGLPKGFRPAWNTTGMLCEELAPPQRELPTPVVRRIDDRKTLIDLYDLNAAGYGIDPEPGRLSAGSPDDWHDAFGFVAYEDDKPVSCAATFVVEDWLYLHMVATAPEAQQRGLAESIVRHSLSEAMKATRLRELVLHSSAAGLPLYRRMGFRATATFHGYYL
jgi:ribosomal protein S18 acetylase RimI-like enzyme